MAQEQRMTSYPTMFNFPGQQRLISFPRAVRALGPNDAARGAALGLSRRCVQSYVNGEWPKVLKALMRQPDLLRALADDAERIMYENEIDEQLN